MSEEEVTLPKNCIKSLKLGLHLSHQTLKSQRPFPCVWWMSMAAAAVMQWQDTPAAWAAFQRGSSPGAETHLGSTGSAAPKLKQCFLPDFFSLWLFFKSSNIFREKQQYIYRKELLSHGLFCVLESILFASYYSYLMTFHYLPGHSETLLPRFEVVFTAGIFLYGFMAKAFCTCIVVWVLHLYLWTKAQWYNISVTFFFFVTEMHIGKLRKKTITALITAWRK